MRAHKAKTQALSKAKPVPASEKPPAKPAPRLGPGEYLPVPTEGITRVEDLPKPKLIRIDWNFKHQACPRCGYSAYRDRVYTRHLHDVGDLDTGRPRELVITYSQLCCSRCHKYFNAHTSDLAPPLSHYTHRVISLAVRPAARPAKRAPAAEECGPVHPSALIRETSPDPSRAQNIAHHYPRTAAPAYAP